ncbi:sensor histidine kinase [Actinomadura rupiterrae]|uniref:sensor histidine kinase n=1 Tax=Actinomadura rupiterrae TaxID=559627 RepID=UPI0020A5C235|nr:sensor histidine kinase [Actinomadura rupiterrae]MCP2337216.1 signal transduction histidine kinase [Actinomadura rupiterrae]
MWWNPNGRRFWAPALYLVAGGALSAVGVYYALYAGLAALVLAITRVGAPASAAVLHGAVRMAEARRVLAARLLHEDVPWPSRGKARDLRGWVRDQHGSLGYRAFGYLAASVPSGLLGLLSVLVTWAYGTILLIYPLLWRLRMNEITETDANGHVRHGMKLAGIWFDTWPRAITLSALGALLLISAPAVTAAAARLDVRVLRFVFRPGQAERRIRALEESRSYAVRDAVETVRRIERDLHDGAQVRLVAVTIRLAMLKETLPPDAPPEVREQVDAAHEEARAAIAELRELVRGIHPPVLDKGLDAALATLGARSPVRAELATDLPERPPAEIESMAYFCAAELLANAAKHADASLLKIDATLGEGRLVLRVTDDGRGGAEVREGGGLAGLADRVATVDGEMTVYSPPGGPTAVTVTLPLRTS